MRHTPLVVLDDYAFRVRRGGGSGTQPVRGGRRLRRVSTATGSRFSTKRCDPQSVRWYGSLNERWSPARSARFVDAIIDHHQIEAPGSERFVLEPAVAGCQAGRAEMEDADVRKAGVRELLAQLGLHVAPARRKRRTPEEKDACGSRVPPCPPLVDLAETPVPSR
jgi:hypothetical protein